MNELLNFVRPSDQAEFKSLLKSFIQSQLQKEIEKYDNFLTDLSLNHALVHQISLFKESLTNKKEG
jgi:hypothetical protein